MGTDCEVGCGEWAIAFAAIVGRLAGTSVTAIEQPLTESDVVGAVAIGEKAIVADTMEAVWQSVQQKAADELIGIECHHLGDAAVCTENSDSDVVVMQSTDESM